MGQIRHNSGKEADRDRNGRRQWRGVHLGIAYWVMSICLFYYSKIEDLEEQLRWLE